ncbi:hypothetical protein ACE6H2_000320 [Prunus campanulata]
MEGDRKYHILKMAEMFLIITLILSSSNTFVPAMARPLKDEKPALTGFMLYKIDRAPVPPTGPSRCIPGHLNEDGDCPPSLHP